MFADFLNRLTQSEPAQLGDTDARLTMAALMVRIARSDDDYSATEITQIDRILTARYALAPAQVTALRQEAEVLEAEAPDTVRFTRAIKAAVSYDDRHDVVKALWQVVLADGSRGKEESALLRLLANLLGVNDRDSNMIRKRVESGST